MYLHNAYITVTFFFGGEEVEEKEYLLNDFSGIQSLYESIEDDRKEHSENATYEITGYSDEFPEKFIYSEPVIEEFEYPFDSDIFELIAYSYSQDFQKDRSEAFYEWVIKELEEGQTPNTNTFEEVYAGSYDSESEFAEQYYDSVYGKVPEMLVNSIDWDSVYNDQLSEGYDILDSTHYFRKF